MQPSSFLLNANMQFFPETRIRQKILSKTVADMKILEKYLFATELALKNLPRRSSWSIWTFAYWRQKRHFIRHAVHLERSFYLLFCSSNEIITNSADKDKTVFVRQVVYTFFSFFCEAMSGCLTLRNVLIYKPAVLTDAWWTKEIFLAANWQGRKRKWEKNDMEMG